MSGFSPCQGLCPLEMKHGCTLILPSGDTIIAHLPSPGGRTDNSPGQAQRSPGSQFNKGLQSRRDGAKSATILLSQKSIICTLVELSFLLAPHRFADPREVKAAEGAWAFRPGQVGHRALGIGRAPATATINSACADPRRSNRRVLPAREAGSYPNGCAIGNPPHPPRSLAFGDRGGNQLLTVIHHHRLTA